MCPVFVFCSNDEYIRMDSKGKPTTRAEQEKLQNAENEDYNKKVMLGRALVQNIVQALVSASASSSEPSAKRMKTEAGVTAAGRVSTRDAYAILDSGFASGKDIVHLPGAIITRLTVGGLVNAMAGVVGGVVNVNNCDPLDSSNPVIPTAQNQTVPDLKRFSTALARSIKARLEIDMMDSTPARIVEMLCPEVTPDEMRSIRRRIYDTVVLGKGTNASANAAALERDEDLPVAARVSMHDIDKVRKGSYSSTVCL